MVGKLRKEQNPRTNRNRKVGIIIDCEEIAISVFPPPREHGEPHCHVISKTSRKVKGKKSDVFPELKIFLDGTEIIIITEGFSRKDILIIGDIIFNDPLEGELTNSEYLQQVWESLHGKY